MRIDKNHWLYKTPIAHRGLWGENVPENSIKAYELAGEKGYPVEIDIRLSKDKQVFVFHDNTLERLTEGSGKPEDLTFEELSKLHLNGTEYKIPLLKEVLKVCENKSPILIEIKNQGGDNEIVYKMLEILKDYQGEFAVQSFNPKYMKLVRKLRPDYIRGILSSGNKYKKVKSKVINYLLSAMFFNFMVKPDFLSYHINGYPLSKRISKGKVKICWTVTSKEDYEKVKPYVDNIIFENFIP